MLREARTSGTEMGKKVAAIMDAGKLVTDEIVIGLIEEKLTTEKGAGFIFDGFPRTLAQADALAALLTKLGQSLHTVIEMRVDDDALVDRITRTLEPAADVVRSTTTRPSRSRLMESAPIAARKTTSVRRADDNEESLRTRLMEYYKKTSPLIGYYYAKGDLRPGERAGGYQGSHRFDRSHLGLNVRFLVF